MAMSRAIGAIAEARAAWHYPTVPAYRRRERVPDPEEANRWREAGARWVGGTLKGLTSKIGYLQRLGVTAIWVSPIFKQVAFHDTYHGYGIHNFLEVDPHFGTRADLVQMVETAHRAGIYVILDIILNHVGDVFGYNPDRYSTATGGMDPRWDGRPYAVRGFHDAHGIPSLPFELVHLEQHPAAWPDGAIWPIEFRSLRFLPNKAISRIGITNLSFSTVIFLI